jgi:hypothetical protein
VSQKPETPPIGRASRESSTVNCAPITFANPQLRSIEAAQKRAHETEGEKGTVCAV